MKKTIEMHGLNSYVSACEAQGLANCWQAYTDNCAGADIMSIGFNPNSGYVYIALEDGIQIGSCMGQSVEYIVTDFNDGTEYFLGSYGEAEDKLKELCETE